MIDVRYARVVAPLAIASVLLVGCGGGAKDDAPATGSPTSQASGAPSGTPSETGIPPMTDDQNVPARLVVDVTIAGGKVTPTNSEAEAKVGQQIVIRVDSDAVDELHVHSNPEHSFPVAAKSGQQFQFTADVPGKVDVELHELNKTVVTIAVTQ